MWIQCCKVSMTGCDTNCHRPTWVLPVYSAPGCLDWYPNPNPRPRPEMSSVASSFPSDPQFHKPCRIGSLSVTQTLVSINVLRAFSWDAGWLVERQMPTILVLIPPTVGWQSCWAVGLSGPRTLGIGAGESNWRTVLPRLGELVFGMMKSSSELKVNLKVFAPQVSGSK